MFRCSSTVFLRAMRWTRKISARCPIHLFLDLLKPVDLAVWQPMLMLQNSANREIGRRLKISQAPFLPIISRKAYPRFRVCGSLKLELSGSEKREAQRASASIVERSQEGYIFFGRQAVVAADFL